MTYFILDIVKKLFKAQIQKKNYIIINFEKMSLSNTYLDSESQKKRHNK